MTTTVSFKQVGWIDQRYYYEHMWQSFKLLSKSDLSYYKAFVPDNKLNFIMRQLKF